MSLVVAVALAAMAAWGSISGPGVPFVWLLGGYGVVGAVNVAVGAALWAHRPGNGTGRLLVVAGLVILTASLYNAEHGALILVGSVAATAPIAAAFHVVVAYPSGRVTDRFTRRLVVAMYAVSVAFETLIYVVDPSIFAGIDWLRVDASAALASRLSLIQGWLTTSGLLLGVVVVVRRWRATSSLSERRVMALVQGSGILVLLWFPLSRLIFQRVVELGPFALFGIQVAAMAALPFAVALPVVTGALAHTVDVAELSSWLGAADDRRPPVRDALARALGDPTLRLLYNVAGTDTYVDGSGHAADLPDGSTTRSWVAVTGPTGRAAIVYDASLLPDRAEVEAAGRVVALAVDHERLTADLRASQEAVRASRHRIAEYADEERRRLARNLHDGVQSLLVVAALHAGDVADRTATAEPSLGAAAARTRDEIDRAITALRQLVHDVMPEMLTERGLFAAVEDLVDGVPSTVRLATSGDDRTIAFPVASAAYFIVAELIGNAVKHAAASRIDVRIERRGPVLTITVTDDGVGGASPTGSGLRGLADRAAALDGRLAVRSVPTEGTSIEVELPCGS